MQDIENAGCDMKWDSLFENIDKEIDAVNRKTVERIKNISFEEDKDMIFEDALYEDFGATTMGDTVGTSEPSQVEWASRPGGPQTDLGKARLAMLRKKKKAGSIVRRKVTDSSSKIN